MNSELNIREELLHYLLEFSKSIDEHQLYLFINIKKFMNFNQIRVVLKNDSYFFEAKLFMLYGLSKSDIFILSIISSLYGLNIINREKLFSFKSLITSRPVEIEFTHSNLSLEIVPFVKHERTQN